jgi:hypothetical protein
MPGVSHGKRPPLTNDGPELIKRHNGVVAYNTRLKTKRKAGSGLWECIFGSRARPTYRSPPNLLLNKQYECKGAKLVRFWSIPLPLFAV